MTRIARCLATVNVSHRETHLPDNDLLHLDGKYPFIQTRSALKQSASCNIEL